MPEIILPNKAQFDVMNAHLANIAAGSGGGGTAATVTYNNIVSGMVATNVQAAIDEHETQINNLVPKANIVQTDVVNDSTKVPSSAVTYAHGQEIDAINTRHNEKISTISFKAIFNDYLGEALDSLHSSIDTRSSGVVVLTTTGPVFHALLMKHTNVYYTGIIMGYVMNTEVYSFAYSDGVFRIANL